MLGNNLYRDWDHGITPQNQCLSDESNAVGVAARDYTPYYYVIMSLSFLMSVAFVFFMNPTMRRSSADENISELDKMYRCDIISIRILM